MAEFATYNPLIDEAVLAPPPDGKHELATRQGVVNRSLRPADRRQRSGRLLEEWSAAQP
jgi:hypothetical protein